VIWIAVGSAAGWCQTVRMTVDDVSGEAASPRPVIGGAFGLLASLRRLGPARVSQLQRDCGLPRTTVHRLLSQLQELG
jgi:IclR helix-turn-helix domain